MISIDGSSGEGGGQILRTSLALSLVTGKPFTIDRIRARRKRPGLGRQHLTAVRAAVAVGKARAEGAELGSQRLVFLPGDPQSGDYHFDVETAGSTTLVLQTVLPALMLASGPSHLRVEGGTHNIHAPPVDFLERTFLPLLGKMGPKVDLTLRKHGFYPAGGGDVAVEIRPEPRLRPIQILERGKVGGRKACAIVSRLPRHIAEREVETVRKRLSWREETTEVREVESAGPGNVVTAEIRSEHLVEVFSGFGQRGVPAEKVAAGVVREVRRYLDAGVPVGTHLADQLLIPMTLAGGGSFRTLAPSSHTVTNIATLKHFCDISIEIEEIEKNVFEVCVGDPRDPE